ncbi:A1 family peptidase [Vibrio sp. Of7-15]|uniref:pepsin-like aspartic protease n=1 Tax=Vibrio sp. Of7-15 TaxID=2724879 RepID=UPI001EF3470A|nr:pepsin-like aspartic protease [Vibrio sp. Of7-15]MCG7499201.1 A1 family peptidase [Vibrio sp. Of7-15]
MDLRHCSGFTLPLQKGPFQNNGATPWYCELGIGSPAQKLKMCFDTGSNFNWVTSNLCSDDGCKHYANARFNLNLSSTFEWINQDVQSVNFGPWGTMQVETGRDRLCLPYHHGPSIVSDLFLASEYSGTQFEELDWDGGIGLPSSQDITAIAPSASYPFRGHHTNTNSNEDFNFFLTLLKMGLVGTSTPYISVQTEPLCDHPTGYIGFGTLDRSYASSLEYLFLPWSCYQQEASYLWTTANTTVKVNGNTIGTNMFFALDTGSSQFKGDNSVLTQVYNLTKNDGPPVSIMLSDENGIEYGELNITRDIYQCKIEAGEKKGKVVSQFQGLPGADDMLLVGSVLMDHLYTVYEYEVISNNDIRPKGVWIFNKPNGPKIIKNRQTSTASLFSR